RLADQQDMGRPRCGEADEPIDVLHGGRRAHDLGQGRLDMLTFWHRPVASGRGSQRYSLIRTTSRESIASGAPIYHTIRSGSGHLGCRVVGLSRSDVVWGGTVSQHLGTPAARSLERGRPARPTNTAQVPEAESWGGRNARAPKTGPLGPHTGGSQLNETRL